MERLFDEKTLLITDVDLDGAGSKIIMNFLYPEAEVLIAERNEVDKAVIESIYSGKYNKIIMTDCSMKNWETVNMVNEFIWNGNQFYLLDHHVSASWLNEQHWADVIIEKDMTLMCGTRLFYDWIIGENEKKNKEFADYIKNHFGEFVELVRLYDTWDWKRTNDMDAYNLSRLFDFKGRDEFCKDIISNLGPNKKLISEKDTIICEVLKKHEMDYINMKKNSYQKIRYGGKTGALLFADLYNSLLGNTICEEHPDIDYCIMIDVDKKTVELRSTKEDVDVSAIAVENGGGGHFHASGFAMTESFLTMMVTIYVNYDN